MTNAFEDLERRLPNGFHDAELVSVQVDYARAEAVLELDIDMEDPESTAPAEVGYRRARVIFAGLQQFSLEPPGYAGPFVVTTITSGSGEPPQSIAMPEVPNDCFRVWFFLTSFNTFIRIAATDVRLEWPDNEHR